MIRWQGLSFENDSWIKESELHDITLILKWRETHPGPAPRVPDNRPRVLRPKRVRVHYQEQSQDSGPSVPLPPPPLPAPLPPPPPRHALPQASSWTIDDYDSQADSPPGAWIGF